MKKILFTLFCCVLGLDSIAQIYEPVRVPQRAPINIPKQPSILDEYYKQQKQDLEIEILREQKKSLELQNQSKTRESNQRVVFKLENINHLNDKLALTEWKELKSPCYVIIENSTITVFDNSSPKYYDLKQIETQADNSTIIYTKQNMTFGIKALENGLFMLVLTENNGGIAYVGTLDKSR